MNTKTTFAVLLLLAGLAGLVMAAEPPGLLNYQGVLRDATDDPVDGFRDMIFRLYNAPGDSSCIGGTLLLTDSHEASGSGAVQVTGGMFNVQLGGGTITAGTESGLAEVFRDNGDVYLEVHVAGEALCPRIHVISAGFSLNADHLDGQDSGYFLNTSGSTQTKTGGLAVLGGVDLGPGVHDDLFAADVTALTGGGSADSYHTHAFAGNAGSLDGIDSSQFLRSDSSDTYTSGTLTFSPGTTLAARGDLLTSGWIYMNQDGPDGLQRLYFYDDGSPTNEFFGWSDSQDYFQFSNDISTGYSMTASLYKDAHSTVYVVDPSSFSNINGLRVYNGDTYFNYDGPEGNSNLYFYEGGTPTGAYLAWDNANNRFSFSNNLYVVGSLSVVGSIFGDGSALTNVSADTLDSLDSSQFLRSDTNDTFSSGALSIGAGASLDVAGTLKAGMLYDRDNVSYYVDPASASTSGVFNGDFVVGNGSGTDNDYIFFDQGLENLSWNEAGTRFHFTDDVGAYSFVDANNLGYYVDPASTSKLNQVQADVLYDRNNTTYWLDPAASVTSMRTYGGLQIGYGSATDTDNIWFDANSEAFSWMDGAYHRFELTDELAIDGPIQTGSYVNPVVPYNRMGVGSPHSDDIDGVDDLLVVDDVEVGSQLFLNRFLYMYGETSAVTDQDQWIYFYNDGTRVGESIMWDDSLDHFLFSDDVWIDGADISAGISATGSTYGGAFAGNTYGSYSRDDNSSCYIYAGYSSYKIYGSGTSAFVQNDPLDPDQVIVYTAPEGDEVATYTRGTGRLVDGEARVTLGETFQWVTNPDIGLTVYLTPVGDWSDLYVAEKSTKEIVVRSVDGAPDGVFDYIVYGLRIGFEESSVIQEKTHESYIPSMEDHRELYTRRPDLRQFNALERFKTMNIDAALAQDFNAENFTASASLRDSIGEYDPAVHGPVEPLDMLVGRGGSGNEPAVVQTAPSEETPERDTEGANSVNADAPPTGSGGDAMPVDRDGNVYARSFRPSESGVASLVEVSEPVESGDVLVIDPEHAGLMSLARDAAATSVFGIVSADPGVVFGARPPRTVLSTDSEERTADADVTEVRRDVNRATGSLEAPVALSGMTLCKVDAGYGAIVPGDLLTTSPTPGHAMRADDPRPGTILGKALEPLDTGTGLIKILVMLR